MGSKGPYPELHAKTGERCTKIREANSKNLPFHHGKFRKWVYLQNYEFPGVFLDDFGVVFSMICPWYPWWLEERTKSCISSSSFSRWFSFRNQLQSSYKFIFKKNNDCQKMVIPPLKKSYDFLSPWFLPPKLPGRKSSTGCPRTHSSRKPAARRAPQSSVHMFTHLVFFWGPVNPTTVIHRPGC